MDSKRPCLNRTIVFIYFQTVKYALSELQKAGVLQTVGSAWGDSGVASLAVLKTDASSLSELLLTTLSGEGGN